MLLLVDGYNVTMRDPRTASLSKQSQRVSLVDRVRFAAHTLAPRGSIVVVFDAREGLGISTEEAPPVKVVYAADADDEIVRRCSAVKGQITVVTDDMRLRARISQDVGRHVSFRGAEELTADGLKAARKPAGSEPAVAREDDLPQGAKAITDELRELWLSEDDT
jgi:predicted RNA-binding protein with PIN domain